MTETNADVRGSPRRGLASATIGFFVGFAGVVVIGPVAEEFEAVMGLSGVFLGLLTAAPNLAGSLLRIPFGAWVEKSGARKPFLLLLGLSIVGMGGMAIMLLALYPDGLSVAHYPLLFLFAALSGCGIATFSVGTAQTSYWYPEERQGTVLALYAGLGNSSPGIFTILLPVAFGMLGLINAYLMWFAFLVVGTIVYSRLAVDAPYFQFRKRGTEEETARELASDAGQELFPSGNAIDSFREAATTPRTWALVTLYFTSFGGFLALTVWFPSYWIKVHDLNVWFAGVLTAVAFALLATFIRIPGGIVSDRVGGEVTAIASFVLVFVSSLMFVFGRAFWIAVVATILIGSGIGIANGAVFKLVPEYVPKAVGGASGLVGGLGAFGGFVVPPILGLFVDYHGVTGYATGFVVYTVLGLVGVAISVGLMRLGSGRERVVPAEDADVSD